MTCDLLIKDTIIIPMDGRKPFRGFLAVDDGIITFCDEGECDLEADEEIDGSGYIITPGFLNAHLHGDFYVFKGLLDNMPLREQYHKTNRLYDLMDEDAMVLSRTLAYAEAVRAGATYIVEHSFRNPGERTIEPFRAVGVRGAVTLDISGLESGLTDLLVENGIDVFINAPSEEDFDYSYLKDIAEISDRMGYKVYAHVAETTWRIAICEERFGIGPIELLHKTGILRRKPVLVHACWLSNRDIDLIADNSATIVSTPVSEMKLGDGVTPIPKLLRKGAKVALGTDGALWNNGADILAEAKAMVLVHSLNSTPGAITESNALDALTSMGAEAVGVEGIGKLQKGMNASFVLFNANSPEICPIFISEKISNLESALIMSAGSRAIDSVYVCGRKIMSDGYIILSDTLGLLEEAGNWLMSMGGRIENILKE